MAPGRTGARGELQRARHTNYKTPQALSIVTSQPFRDSGTTTKNNDNRGLISLPAWTTCRSINRMQRVCCTCTTSPCSAVPVLDVSPPNPAASGLRRMADALSVVFSVPFRKGINVGRVQHTAQPRPSSKLRVVGCPPFYNATRLPLSFPPSHRVSPDVFHPKMTKPKQHFHPPPLL